jgi:hypothetical protein
MGILDKLAKNSEMYAFPGDFRFLGFLEHELKKNIIFDIIPALFEV